MRFVGKRLSYANVAMTLALVFAMTGGAYAAKKYLITSTKQISPSVLKQLKGAKGPAGPAGVAGAVGPAGPQGSPGAKGEKGAAGEKGATGAIGPQGLQGVKGDTGAQGVQGVKGDTGPQGPEGSPWTAGGTLPSGKTETGAFAVGPTAAAGVYFMPLSFNIPLASPVSTPLNILEPGEENENCHGTFEHPQANPGQLCVYLRAKIGGSLTNGYVGSAAAGLMLGFEATEAGAVAFGSWAVTAP